MNNKELAEVLKRQPDDCKIMICTNDSCAPLVAVSEITRITRTDDGVLLIHFEKPGYKAAKYPSGEL